MGTAVCDVAVCHVPQSVTWLSCHAPSVTWLCVTRRRL